MMDIEKIIVTFNTEKVTVEFISYDTDCNLF